jgi:hypothetical protein
MPLLGLLPHFSPPEVEINPDIDLVEFFKAEDDDGSFILWDHYVHNKEDFALRLKS